MGKLEDIIKERNSVKDVIVKVKPKKGGAREGSGRKPALDNKLVEGGLYAVNKMIREHGITRVTRTKDGKKLAAKERFLNMLDVLYEKGIEKQDTKSAVEYLNRTAGAVSQVIDLNENKKKLIVLGTGKAEGQPEREQDVSKVVRANLHNTKPNE